MWLIYAVTFLHDILISWPIVLVLRLLWGENLRFDGHVLCVTLKKGSWPMRTWYRRWGGTTFGHSIMYSPGAYVRSHEMHHVKQYQSVLLKGFLQAAVVFAFTLNIGISLFVWLSSFYMFILANCATAWLRGEDPYYGSVHEEHAYAMEHWDND